MPTLNLGILAHVDAGKTTLSERLLFETGATGHLGRVDHGDTTTDADAIERRRGITIRAAVVAFSVPTSAGPLKVNLIDTPGHADFVAEVERALAVLDGAVLVVSAVEGVQARTRVLIRILARLDLPYLVFVNKVDRAGASWRRTVNALREDVPGAVVAITEATGEGARAAGVRTRSGPAFVEDVVETLATYDEELLGEYVDGERAPDDARARSALATQARRGRAHPVLVGSALAGAGVRDVVDALATYLPSTVGDQGASLHATVFKIDRDTTGHRIAYVRLHAGTLASRDHVVLHHRLASGVVAVREARALDVRSFELGAETRGGVARAGDIATVVGLGEVAVGDQLGHWEADRSGRQFAPPGLESVVRPRDPADRIALFAALQQLAEQDPLIDARLEGIDGEMTVDVYGEVQKEVLAARLLDEYALAADFLPTQTVHVERVVGTAEAQAATAMGNASLGLRVGPAPAGTRLDYALGEGVERGYLLPSFHVAIEETLAAELSAGLYGWRITDLRVRLVHSRFHAPTPSAGEFRTLTHRAFREALQRAGTAVCAPLSRIDLLVPAASLTGVLALVLAAGGRPEPVETGAARCRVIGTIPTGRGRRSRAPAARPDLRSRSPAHRAGRLLRGPWRTTIARASFRLWPI
ncbi:MAG: translation factor GTPase family protein [Nocardioidaceae bacterium]